MFLSTASHLVGVLWAGIIIGISFVAQPAKFKTPQLTRAVALAAGRQMFRSMHIAEGVLASAGILLSVFSASQNAYKPFYLATLVLLIQVFALMPPLSRRVDQLLAGQELHGSHHHLVFAALEVAKLALLITFALPLFTLTYHG
ncbi:hypothetical protein [Undibacterium sp.]|uniref:hypothetical protein n=1 Tax=Undibacterium sp. TaxID=1914977 RepID=UPI00374D8A0E